MDEDSFCTLAGWHNRIEGLEMKQVIVNDKALYLLNAKKHPPNLLAPVNIANYIYV